MSHDPFSHAEWNESPSSAFVSPPLRRYFALSRSPWYSLLFVTPMVLLYQSLAWLVNLGSVTELRNGADVVLRMLLDMFGLGAPKIMGVTLIVGVVAIWLWQRRNHGDEPIVAAYLGLMLIESLVWAGVLLLALLTADSLLLTTSADTVLRTALLAVGAGIYEEALFRLLLVTLLMLLFHRVLLWHRLPASLAAIGVAGLLFALFHHVGPMGEPFAWNSVAYRSVAGVLLGALFLWRGFGITAYAHIGYDLMVLGLITLQ